jgi:chitodextrinase
MLASVLLSAVLLAPAAPVPKATKPLGPPPRLLGVVPTPEGRVVVTVVTHKAVQTTVTVPFVENGQQRQRAEVRDITVPEYQNVTLDNTGATFKTADDKPLTADQVTAKLKTGGVLVLPPDGKETDPGYLAILSGDAILVSYKKDEKKVIADLSHHTMPAPTILSVKADERGVVLVSAMGKKEVTVKVPQSVTENGETKVTYVDVKQTVEGMVPTPFDDVKPDVTTADGKVVSFEDAKKKLAAGAVVLVSRDGKPVGEAYRKTVKADTLILTSAKMAEPRPNVPAAPLSIAPVGVEK